MEQKLQLSAKMLEILSALATQYRFPAHCRSSQYLQKNVDALKDEIDKMDFINHLKVESKSKSHNRSNHSGSEMARLLYSAAEKWLYCTEMGSYGRPRNYYLSNWAPDFKLLLTDTIESVESMQPTTTMLIQPMAQSSSFKTSIAVYYTGQGENHTLPTSSSAIFSLLKEAMDEIPPSRNNNNNNNSNNLKKINYFFFPTKIIPPLPIFVSEKSFPSSRR